MCYNGGSLKGAILMPAKKDSAKKEESPQKERNGGKKGVPSPVNTQEKKEIPENNNPQINISTVKSLISALSHFILSRLIKLKAINKLNGMFAFAIWDNSNNILFLIK